MALWEMVVGTSCCCSWRKKTKRCCRRVLRELFNFWTTTIGHLYLWIL